MTTAKKRVTNNAVLDLLKDTAGDTQLAVGKHFRKREPLVRLIQKKRKRRKKDESSLKADDDDFYK